VSLQRIKRGSGMNMKELGELLRSEREKKGLSLDEVHESTKISKSALRSLESGLAEDLPHPVYTKGFIKNYAELLGLDGDELAAEFTRNISREGRYEEMEEAHEAVMAAESDSKPGRGTVLSLVATLILLAVLGWLVYDLFLKPPADVETSTSKQPAAAANATPEASGSGEEAPEEPDSETAAPESSSAAEQQSPQAAAPAPKPPRTEAAVQPQARRAAREPSDQTAAEQPPAFSKEARNASLASPSPSGNRSEALEPERITYAPENGTQESPEPGAEQASPEISQNQHTLRIEAVEACWFEAQVDGAARDVYLRPGESVTLTFANDLMIKLGNAGGVDLFYDGEEHSLEASSGEVRTLTFP